MLAFGRKWIIGLPQNAKRAGLVIFDVLALSGSLWLSYSLRIDRLALPDFETWLLLLSAPVVAIPIFIRMGLYRSVIRYMPERALWTILWAVALATAAWVVFAFLISLTGKGYVPRSVPIVYWALGSILIGGSRFAAKWLLWPSTRSHGLDHPVVAIYGAGEAGSRIVSTLKGSHSIAAFIDDDTALQRREVAGLRVYPPSHLPTLVRDFGIKTIVLCAPGMSVARRKELVAEMSVLGVKVQWLPEIRDLVTGRHIVSQMREIEIDDLLGRSSVPPDVDLLRNMIKGRSIMVTGAGGSIGSELCRKIIEWAPTSLVMLEANEFALYNIDRQIAAFAGGRAVPVLGSVTNRALLDTTLGRHAVDVVFHAAAHKHVPMIESNVIEGIQNNVFGTKTMVDAATAAGVRDFVLISTDKAVRPTNVMGATKRWAELIVLLQAAKHPDRHFSAVRFGNVLGSNGSVVPLFKEQIARGGPITVTDLNMTRYFMSIKEAVELIVQAGALSDSADIFLLDMGEPVPIVDLATKMIQLAGLTVRDHANPDGDIEIVAVGKRPGEKMYEELFYDDLTATQTTHPKIMRSSIAGPDVHFLTDRLAVGLADLKSALDDRDEAKLRRVLFQFIDDTGAGSRSMLSQVPAAEGAVKAASNY